MSDSSTQGAATKALTKKPRQGRSPAFPFIPISKALDRAEVFRIAEGGRPKHFSPVNSAFAAWKLGPKTGPALQTIAAMGHYGLFEFQGSADTRSARLTDLAFNILLDKQPISSERDALIALAALNPAIHSELWLKWGDSLPSDPTLETYLIRDRGFSETGARDLIAEYKATMEFAKLGQSGIIPSVDDGSQAEDSPPVEIVVGDMVQVEIRGALQLARVRAVQDHRGQPWIFVEGSEEGIPMEQAVLQPKAPPASLAPPILPEAAKHENVPSSYRKTVIPFDEGDVTLVFPANLTGKSYLLLSRYLELYFGVEKTRAEMGAEKFDEMVNILYPGGGKKD